MILEIQFDLRKSETFFKIIVATATGAIHASVSYPVALPRQSKLVTPEVFLINTEVPTSD